MEIMQAKIIELTNDDSQAHRKICLNSIYSFCFVLCCQEIIILATSTTILVKNVVKTCERHSLFLNECYF